MPDRTNAAGSRPAARPTAAQAHIDFDDVMLELAYDGTRVYSQSKLAQVLFLTVPNLESGQYFNGLRPARAHAQTYDDVARDRLRRLSLELAGLERSAAAP